MILSTSIPTENFSAFQRDQQFELDPPLTNTFVPGATVSFIHQTGGVEIQWTEAFSEGPATPALEKMTEEIIVRARRDTDRFPRSARAHTNLGLALINRGQLEEAASEFEAAIDSDPKHYIAIVNLARVRVRQKRFDQAKELYEHVREASPEDITSLLGLAYIALRQGEYSSAIEQLKTVLHLDQKSALARYQIAVAFLALGKPHEAIAHLRAAAILEVRSPAVHQALAVAYNMSGDLRRAARSFKAALTLRPMMREAVHGLSNVFLQLSEFESATQLLTSYLETQPDDSFAREGLALAYKEQKRYSAARTQLMEVLNRLKSDAQDTAHRQTRLMNNIAVSYARENTLDEAERWIAKAISLSPNYDALPYLNLARFLMKRNQLQKAQQTIQECKARFPQHEDTIYLSAACLERMRQYDDAIEELDAFIQTGNPKVGAYAYLGCLLADAKRNFKDALEILRKGFELYPTDPGIVNNLAYVHLIRGEPALARPILDSAHPDTSSDVFLTCTYGLLLLWEGNIMEGTNRYLKAERMARQDGRFDLSRTVVQKMHLELARAHSRLGDLITAQREVEKGLRIKGGKDTYRDDLLSLLTELKDKSRNSSGPAPIN